MKRSEVKKELKKMIEIERKIIDVLASGEGTEKEQNYACSKLFEVAQYIVTLKDYLEATKNNED